MKLLLFVSLCLIALFYGCSSPYSELKSIGIREVNNMEIPSYFNQPDFHKALFKSTVEIMGTNLSGLIMIKKSDDTTFKATLFNELGMNFFDLQFSNNNIEVKSIAEVLNYPILIDAIKQDLELAIMTKTLECKSDIFKDKENIFNVYKFNNEISEDCGIKDQVTYYYWIKQISNCLERIDMLNGTSKQVSIYFDQIVDGFPNKIVIEHQNFEFKMELKLVNYHGDE